MELIGDSKQLPKNWEVRKLGEVCQIEKSQGIYTDLPYIGMEDIESNTTRFIGSTEPQSVKSSTFKFSSDHILYGRLRPYLNKVLAPNFTGHCSTEIFPIKPSKCLNKYFLLYWLLMDSTVKRINATCTGARMPRANISSVFEFYFSFPSLLEQNQIVAILDNAFENIDKTIVNTDKNLANSHELFESYLNSIFNYKGEGWLETTVGDVCKLSQGLAINSKTKFLLVSKSSLPLLRITDLRNNTEEQFIAEQGYPLNCLVGSEDIIYTRTGNSLGLVFTGRKGVLHNNSFKIVPNIPLLDRRYLFWWLQNPSFKETIIKLASKAAQPDITHKLFNIQSITLPPLTVQKEFVEKIEQFSIETQRLEAIYRQKITALQELKQSILHQAFTGELTADIASEKVEATQEKSAA